MSKDILIENKAALHAFCQQLKTALPTNFTCYLHGNLGAGKTTLCQLLIKTYGYQGVIKSPTYTLVESYQLDAQTIFHFDLYRLNDSLELEFMGIDDYFNTSALRLIEWPEKAKDMLPQADIDCYIHYQDDEQRLLQLEAHSKQGQIVLEKI